MKILIDTNIIVYSINKSSPKSEVARTFLQNNANHLYLAHQNILEALRVLTHKKFPTPMTIKEAIFAVHKIADACGIIAPNYMTYPIAFEFIKKHSLNADKIFDAYLAATALSNTITSIATDNSKDFQKFEMNLINPFEKKV
jgi:predicted nucleic acid-binding protein